MIRISRNRIVVDLFYCWYIAIAFAYVFFAITALKNHTFIYWDYSKVNVAFPWSLITHIKDIVMVVLSAFLLINRRNIRLLLPMIPFFIFYSAVTFLQNRGEFTLRMVAGTREFLPVLICLMLFNETIHKNGDSIEVRRLRSLVLFVTITEFLFVFAQIYVEGIWHKIGKAGYRLPGTMGNGGSLGYLGIGLALIIYTLYSTELLKAKGTLLLLLLSGMISLGSGSRNALFCFISVLLFFLLNCFFSIFKQKRNGIHRIAILILVILAIPIITTLSAYAGRGALSVSGGGRIKLFQMLLSRSIFQLLIGQGIADRTNALAVLTGGGTEISDGTITVIIAQFGLIGILLFIVLMVLFIKTLYKYIAFKNRSVLILFLISLFITIISINIFEQPILIASYLILYYLMAQKRINDRKKYVDTESTNSCT